MLTILTAAMLGAGYTVYQISYRTGLNALADTGRIRVEQATDRLSGQLAAFRVLVNVLARHPTVVKTIHSGVGLQDTRALLEHSVLTYGAAHIAIVASDGSVLVGTTSGEKSFAGPLLTAAMNARLGRQHGLSGAQRVLRYSRGIIADAPPPQGAVIVSADLATLEFEWGVDPEAIAFFDPDDVVFASNRPSLLLRQDRSDAPTQPEYGVFPGHRDAYISGHTIWRFGSSEELPAEALVAELTAPQLGMLARGFIDIAPAREAALVRGLLAAAVIGFIGLGFLIFIQWRRRMSDRLAIEARANAQLEARVATRSAELKATQDQLVQASKLTALGQMSAGISHELNQPLAAIMNFAQNGGKLLEIGRADDVRANLDQIAGQVGRADRIIRNLRGFARAEEEAVEPVDLTAAITEALALVESAIAQNGAVIERAGPISPIMVIGGRVRLQQVIVNLISNALDATTETAAPVIVLSTNIDGRQAKLTVQDNGPGISDPERVFEPFYTTKDLGASKGLGLGLSISYGIIGSFGGALTCRNVKDGGAIFVISLPLAGEAE
ncbi:MAG: ATP-binding protein [Pseudomonadota bacterium]